MARKADVPPLDAGDRFPTLNLTLTDGRSVRLPGELPHAYNVVLINRGAWCPFCVAQLRAFQSGVAQLAEAGIGVLSLSADTQEHAAALAAEHRIEFPLAWGASIDLVSRALGVYYEPHPPDGAPHFHAAGFVLGPGGRVLLAVYSSGPIGRLIWRDVLGYVQHVRAHS
jgi:peroxiredoxin